MDRRTGNKFEQDISQRSRTRDLLILLCVSAPSFMLNLDANIVAVSLPSIAHSLGASFTGIEWVITAYTLAFASMMMPAGTLADRYGRKPTLIAGLTLFTTASFFCGAASNLPILIAARAVQGTGAAMQLSAGIASLSHSFSGAHRARAFAFWGSVVGAGSSLGPVAGGVITQSFGWEWAFYINLPIGAAAVALSLAVIDDSRDPHATHLDLSGVLTFAGFLFLTTLALISGNRDGWTSTHIAAEIAGAIGLLVAFIVVERRQSRPMLDFSFLAKPTYLGATIAQFAFAAGLLTMLTYLPIYFQSGLGYPPIDAGLMMLPMALPLLIVPRIVTKQLAHRYSGRALLTAGLVLVSLGLAWMAFASTNAAPGWILAGMLLTGIGAGILNGETTKVAMTVIPPERAGMASGLSGTIRFAGVVVGFAALGVILYGRIAVALKTALPSLPDDARRQLVHEVASGNLASFHPVSLSAFGQGYEAMLLAGTALTAASAALAWLLVRSDETAPMVRNPPDDTVVLIAGAD